MKHIWCEIIELAEGHGETYRNLTAEAWWDKSTGTLRLELDVLDCVVKAPPAEIDHCVLFGTFESREEATREIIAQIDLSIARHKPEAQRIAALSYECGGWWRALHGHEAEPITA